MAKAAATLSVEQRWLLSVVWPGRMARVLIDPDNYIPLLKESRCSGGWPPNPDLPEWLQWYKVSQAGIDGGRRDECPTTSVTWTKLKRFTRDLPEEVRVELRRTVLARTGTIDGDRRALRIALGLEEVGPAVQLELFEAAQ